MDKTESGIPGGEADGLPERHVTFSQVVAYNLAHYRRAAGLGQEQLGERLGGWSAASVSAAERSWDGKRIRKFDADEIAGIALALGVPVIALFLPPADAGTAVRYVLAAEQGQPDITSILPVLAGDAAAETPAQAAVRQRLMSIGGTKYVVRDAVTAELVQAGEILFRAHQEADAILAKARGVTAEVIRDSRTRVEELEHDAQMRHKAAMESLVPAREELERRVDDLRAFEREYRSRMLAYLENQVAELRAGAAPEIAEMPFFQPARQVLGAPDDGGGE